jgi:Family of unknown function (DUF6527)
MFDRLWHVLRSLLERTGIPHATYRHHVTDLPDKPNPRVVKSSVNVTMTGHRHAVSRPGGCGKTLETNLLPMHIRHAQSRSSQSVWLKTGCGCHFVIRDGQVRWT